jgi:hypothetical protein
MNRNITIVKCATFSIMHGFHELINDSSYLSLRSATPIFFLSKNFSFLMDSSLLYLFFPLKRKKTQEIT